VSILGGVDCSADRLVIMMTVGGDCYYSYYTVSHKKRATLFLIITRAFLGRFLYFLHQWKEEETLYTGVNNIYHFTL